VSMAWCDQSDVQIIDMTRETFRDTVYLNGSYSENTLSGIFKLVNKGATGYSGSFGQSFRKVSDSHSGKFRTPCSPLFRSS